MIRSSYPIANRPDGPCHWVPGEELVEHPDELLGGALRRQRREAADVGEQNAENVKFFSLIFFNLNQLSLSSTFALLHQAAHSFCSIHFWLSTSFHGGAPP